MEQQYVVLLVYLGSVTYCWMSVGAAMNRSVVWECSSRPWAAACAPVSGTDSLSVGR